jgi:tetratricopeptide (TPR) repeat protein/tRNA A-37 threonylcarbamoyl transferase component Bud32
VPDDSTTPQPSNPSGPPWKGPDPSLLPAISASDPVRTEPKTGVPQSSTWFLDEAGLLSELRVARQIRMGTPVIPGYEEIVELRRGGQGVVYSANQKSTKRRVAIKVLLEGGLASASARRRFEREIDLAASLRHPGIVRVYDSGITGPPTPGFAYLVMEFVEGVSLADAVATLRQQKLSAAEFSQRVVQLFVRVIEAVNHAHQRGVMHRDLKPGNIRVDSAGEPRVLDFGLAKLGTGANRDVTVTTSGQFVGSLPWASPEQVALADGTSDAADVDVRTDIYSIGAMLYQALTGRLPIDVSGSVTSAVQRISSQEPARLRSIVRDVPEDLETIVHKCLAKDRARRYESAAALAQDLNHFLAGEPIQARRDSAWYTMRTSARRYRTIAYAGGAVIIVLAAGLTASIVFYRQAVKARDQADLARQLATSESSRRERTLEFLNQMLTSADPGKDGREVKVVDVIDAAERDLAPGMLDAETEISVRSALGATYASLAILDKAESNLQRVIELSPGHPQAYRDVSAAYNNLSGLRARSGKTQEAIDYALQSQRYISSTAPGFTPEDRHYLRARVAEGDAYIFSSQPKKAKEVLAEVLEVQRRILPKGDADTLNTMNSLGIATRRMGDPAGAEALYREAYQASTAPEDSATKLNLLSNLVQAIDYAGRWAEAEPMYKDLIARQERVLGADHPSTLGSISNLSVCLIDQGKLSGPEGAEAYCRRAVEGLTRRLGANHVDTLLATNNLAKIVQDQGRLDDALVLFERAYEGQKAQLGEDNPQSLVTLANIAVVKSMSGKHEEAVEIQRRVLASQSRTIGAKNLSTLITHNNIGMGLQGAKRLDEAAKEFEIAVTGAIETLKPEHNAIGSFSLNYARCLVAMQQDAEALPHAQRAAEVFLKNFGPADARAGKAVEVWASILDRLGKPDEAAAVRAKAKNTKPAS